ncbi:aromatic ring-hydroxylating dioxygenase subunit alpha [Sphingosinicella ginsenosidimutans]|uniref:Aromatic ring-hydroxylating dioxygenase subunit alpha n=1 Tax=Allosphingosinicella ginsenosidimutans TaxID=1176539 RepID=A0A5C6TT04_9SPHN|nr:aromatic ring-hydroxylating dioxygenase subunit alpha [Sphingosinicella ginsenosidimutans]TXC63319.1 aromatic ring-hydroxylating dioxygenase subunit alpha [Sphingosinicella ginsenosidimutans]
MSDIAHLPLSQSDPIEDLSLPGWTYWDADYFKVEMERVIRPSWQIVCHDSDMPNPGDWRTLELLGESILVIRGQDGAARAFANVCRHRGSRLVDGHEGCAKRLTCPYHAWTYATDGRLVALPHREDYRGFDAAEWGLIPVELERWRGFLFVRLESGGPSVAAMMAPYETEIAPHRFEELRALGRITMRPRDVNWKNVADNYSDGLHIDVAHPGLTRLFGKSYAIEAGAHVDRMSGALREQPSSNISERAYQQFLPAGAGRTWLYFKLWPNVAFDIYPDQVDFMHFVPVSPTRTMIREISYALPDDRREMKAARYLNWRINRQVNAEDTALIRRVQQGMGSSLYRPGPLGESEVCLRSFARKLRRIIPETRLDAPPANW